MHSFYYISKMERDQNWSSRPKLSLMEKELIENSIDSMRQRIDQIQQLPDVVEDKLDRLTDVISTDVYKIFDFDTRSSKYLPIYSSEKAILEAIEKHYATIIVGNTGCGKTTQVCICDNNGGPEFYNYFLGSTNSIIP